VLFVKSSRMYQQLDVLSPCATTWLWLVYGSAGSRGFEVRKPAVQITVVVVLCFWFSPIVHSPSPPTPPATHNSLDPDRLLVLRAQEKRTRGIHAPG
jgi:hypothetical protein